MIHQNPFRKWTVEVSDDSGFAGDHYEVYWDQKTQFGKTCEQFTIASKHNPDNPWVRLLLFEDGSMQTWSWHPAMIQSSPEKLYVVIGILKLEDSVLGEYLQTS